RSKVFRAGHDTSLPESEVPSPGRWIRSGRHAGCGIDHALCRLSRPILCVSHQVAVSCADPVQKQVPGECGWSGEGSAPPGLGRVWRGWGAWSQGVRFANPLDSPRPVTEEARLIGQWLSERLGRQFIVENRPGAGTNIGTEAVVRSPPDGFTLLLAVSANAINA